MSELPEHWELIPTGKIKMDTTWGMTITVDIDKAPCPACWGAGTIVTDDGYDEDGNLTAEYDIECVRCKGNGKYKQEMETDGTENS
jgi:DnaJ-class molecular chaperone